MAGYPEIQCYIDGRWRAGGSGRGQDIIDPADESVLGVLQHADSRDLDAALQAAQAGFELWRRASPLDRAGYLHKVAVLLADRAEAIAGLLSLEQGKCLREARVEMDIAADFFRYCAEEGLRVYGRIIPARQAGYRQMVLKSPIGPALLLTPWNFPGMSPARKIAMALAAGCSCVLKASEEAPAAAMAVVQACHDAGIPPGVVNLVFGDPAGVTARLMDADVIRKISFTGSIPVGKELARRAADRLQRCTLELGGHAPVLIMEDADIGHAVSVLTGIKFLRNAGQVCTSPTRFFVHERVHDEFVRAFTEAARGIRVGRGQDPASDMGPLANGRRVQAMEGFVADALARGARLQTGGQRIGTRGYFWAPTLLTDVPAEARVMNEEPFGPIAPVVSFRDPEDAIAQANALPYGLAAFAFTDSMRHAQRLADTVEAGVLVVNHVGVSYPETPFGGVKESGDGREGGPEGLESFMVTRLVSEHAHAG